MEETLLVVALFYVLELNHIKDIWSRCIQVPLYWVGNNARSSRWSSDLIVWVSCLWASQCCLAEGTHCSVVSVENREHDRVQVGERTDGRKSTCWAKPC